MNQRSTRGAACFVAVVVIALAAGPYAIALPAAIDPAVANVIARLGADDPADRERAAAELLALGRAARPGLVAAMNGTGGGEVPQVRLAAAELVMKLPFDRPDDPPAFAGMLERYGQTPLA